MNRSEQLARKRLDLQARAAEQREQIAALGSDLHSRLGAADRVVSLAGAVVKNPFVSVAAIGATLALGPWRILKWVGQGAFFIGAAKRVYSMFRK